MASVRPALCRELKIVVAPAVDDALRPRVGVRATMVSGHTSRDAAAAGAAQQVASQAARQAPPAAAAATASARLC